MILRDIEAKDDFKFLVVEIKGDATFNATIGKISNLASPSPRTEVDRLFARLIIRITEEDDKAENTRLPELFHAILQKADK